MRRALRFGGGRRSTRRQPPFFCASCSSRLSTASAHLLRALSGNASATVDRGLCFFLAGPISDAERPRTWHAAQADLLGAIHTVIVHGAPEHVADVAPRRESLLAVAPRLRLGGARCLWPCARVSWDAPRRTKEDVSASFSPPRPCRDRHSCPGSSLPPTLDGDRRARRSRVQQIADRSGQHVVHMG